MSNLVEHRIGASQPVDVIPAKPGEHIVTDAELKILEAAKAYKKIRQAGEATLRYTNRSYDVVNKAVKDEVGKAALELLAFIMAWEPEAQKPEVSE